MTNITKAAQDALAALDEIHAGKRHPQLALAVAQQLRAALQDKAVGAREPVARVDYSQRGNIAWLFGKQMADGTELFAHPAPVVPDGFAIVPVEPTAEMLGGLARSIMLAFDINAKSPALLINVLTNLGHEIPQWLRDEIKDPESNYALSKGTRAVIIYRAMLAASQQKGGQ